MRKGQLAIPLVLLAIVAIIALIGLILMLVRGTTGMGIGDVYGTGERGIAPTYPVPPYIPGRAIEYPIYPYGVTTIGTRTPIMIFFKGEYGTIYESSRCWVDLYPLIPNAQDKFSCYSIPTTGVAQEVTGWFPPSSSAAPRPPLGYTGRLGGDIYCYENTPYERKELLERIKTLSTTEGWTTDIVNNEEVAVCQKGAWFIYPQ